MKYRRSGKSGILLPEVSLGLWQNFGGMVPYESSRERVLYAVENGVCHLDLANNYGPPYGSAEETFGRIMEQDLRPHRDELFISSKAGYDMWDGPYGNWGSRKYLISSLDQSLRRMKLDYVDIFYSHRFDPETPIEETMQALVDIVRQGKALYAGISNYPADKADIAYKYLADHDVPCLLHQVKYSMLVRKPEAEGIIEGAAKAGSGFIAFSPLAQGLLTNRYMDGIPAGSRATRGGSLKAESIDEALLAKVRALGKIAADRGQTLAQMALSWDLRDPRVTSVIIGASSVAQLSDNLQASGHTDFSADELAAIDSILAGDLK